jgi:hypothetical protein
LSYSAGKSVGRDLSASGGRKREELRVFENRVLRKMDHGENCIIMNFTAHILH